ncbi:MAG: hypothetical protein H0U49_00465 [Parachlamydiaceae bacterium]|nr:hypothetical protein [Parachlamydiaceae bacterium]
MISSLNLIRKAIVAFSLLAFAQVSADCCPPMDCCVSSDCGPSYSNGTIYVRGDFLYLRAVEDGLSNCGPALILDDIDVDGFPIRRVCTQCKTQNNGWDFGYRVAAGLRLSICEPSPWEISGAWTHFGRGSGLKCCNSNDSKWRLKFDYADLLISYYLPSCSSLNIKFFGGLRGALIDQQLHNNFINEHDDFARCDIIRECILSNQKNKDKFKGLGPLLGFETGWDFGYGLNIFFNADAGCLFGEHRTRVNFSEFTQGETFKSESRCEHQACQFFVDSAVGVRWNLMLCRGTELSLQVGFEQHTYFNANYIGNRGNLNLYGGFFSAGLKF